jgi:hypothetical protein
VVWISLADQKRGFEGVLWCQDMSRVCPGCHQTTPRKAREASCIREAYGEHAGAKAECRMQNAEWPGEATQSQPKAISKPVDSQGIGTLKPPQSHPHATLKPPSSHPQATWGFATREQILWQVSGSGRNSRCSAAQPVWRRTSGSIAQARRSLAECLVFRTKRREWTTTKGASVASAAFTGQTGWTIFGARMFAWSAWAGLARGRSRPWPGPASAR